MQHGSLRAPVRVFVAAVLLCLSFLAAPKAAAAQLQDVNGITLLSFDSQQMVCRRVLRLQRLPFRLPFPPV